MLLKCYHHLHLVVDCDVQFIENKSYEDCCLDIFEMNSNTSEPMIELVNKELLNFKRF